MKSIKCKVNIDIVTTVVTCNANKLYRVNKV